jgi:hypothetical protein
VEEGGRHRFAHLRHHQGVHSTRGGKGTALLFRSENLFLLVKCVSCAF